MTTDAFAYSDGALGTVADGIWEPTVSGDDLNVSSGVVINPGDSTDRYATYQTARPSADHSSEATVTLTAGNYANAGVFVRGDNSAFTCYYGVWENSSNYVIYKVVAGSYGTVATQSGAPASGTKTLRLEVSGSSLELFADDVSVVTGTDTDITSGNYVGICSYMNSGATSPTIDDWEGLPDPVGVTQNLYLGANAVDDVRLGADQVDALYLGVDLVWEPAAVPPAGPNYAYSGADPTEQADTSTYTLCTVFTVSTAVNITHFRVWSPGNGDNVASRTLYIWADNSVDYSQTIPSVLSAGWNEIELDTPYTAWPGVGYYIGCDIGDGGVNSYGYVANALTPDVSDGTVTLSQGGWAAGHDNLPLSFNEGLYGMEPGWQDWPGFEIVTINPVTSGRRWIVFSSMNAPADSTLVDVYLNDGLVGRWQVQHRTTEPPAGVIRYDAAADPNALRFHLTDYDGIDRSGWIAAWQVGDHITFQEV